MGEPEQKKSGGSGWIIALVAVFLLGGMCVVGLFLAVFGAAGVFLFRAAEKAPTMQERMTDMAPDEMPRIPDFSDAPKLPQFPDLGAPSESKPPGE